MTTHNLQARAQTLIGQLDPGKLAAVVQLLEVMIDEDQISEEEEAAVARSKEWFKHNPGIPLEQIASELGFSMDDIRAGAKEPVA